MQNNPNDQIERLKAAKARLQAKKNQAVPAPQAETIKESPLLKYFNPNTKADTTQAQPTTQAPPATFSNPVQPQPNPTAEQGFSPFLKDVKAPSAVPMPGTVGGTLDQFMPELSQSTSNPMENSSYNANGQKLTREQAAQTIKQAGSTEALSKVGVLMDPDLNKVKHEKFKELFNKPAAVAEKPKVEKPFWENAFDGWKVSLPSTLGNTVKGLVEGLEVAGTTPLMPMAGLAGQPKFEDYGKLQKDQFEGKADSFAPELEKYAAGKNAESKQIAEDRGVDSESWGFMVGSLAPQGIGIATAIAVGAVNPVAGAAIGYGNTVALGSMAFGAAGEEYDEYVKQKNGALTQELTKRFPTAVLEDGSIDESKLPEDAKKWAKPMEYDPNARLGTMMLAAAIEQASEAIPVAKFVPKAFKGKLSKMLLGNTDIASREGADLLQEFASTNASRGQMVKNLTREMAEGALLEGPTELVAEVGGEFSTWLYKEKKDRATWQEITEQGVKAMVGGSIMGGALGPLSYGAQQIQNQRRRNESGKVVIAQNTATGEALEILGIANAGKDGTPKPNEPIIYQAIRPNGKTIDVNENEIGEIVDLPLKTFNELLKGKQTGQQIIEAQANESTTAAANTETDQIRAQHQPMAFQDVDGNPMISAAKFNGENVFVTAINPDGSAVIQKPGEDKKVVPQSGLSEQQTVPFEQFMQTFAPAPAQTQVFDPANPIQTGETINVDGQNWTVTSVSIEEGLVQLENEDGTQFESMPVADLQQFRQPQEAQAQEQKPNEGAEKLREIFTPKVDGATSGDQVSLGGSKPADKKEEVNMNSAPIQEVVDSFAKKMGIEPITVKRYQDGVDLDTVKNWLAKNGGQKGEELADIVEFPEAAKRLIDRIEANPIQNETPTGTPNPQPDNVPAPAAEPIPATAEQPTPENVPAESVGEGVDNEVQVGNKLEKPYKQKNDGSGVVSVKANLKEKEGVVIYDFETTTANTKGEARKQPYKSYNTIEELIEDIGVTDPDEIEILKNLSKSGTIGVEQIRFFNGIGSATVIVGGGKSEIGINYDPELAKLNQQPNEPVVQEVHPSSDVDNFVNRFEEKRNELGNTKEFERWLTGEDGYGGFISEGNNREIFNNIDEKSQEQMWEGDFSGVKKKLNIKPTVNEPVQQAEPKPEAGQNDGKKQENQEVQPRPEEGQGEVGGQGGINTQERDRQLAAGNATTRKRETEAQPEEVDKINRETAYDDVRNASTRDELIDLYETEAQNLESIDPIQQAIANTISDQKIEPDSFRRFNDPNNINFSIARNWFSKKGQGAKIDLIAQEASESFTPGNSDSITPQEVAQFLTTYTSVDQLAQPSGNPKLKEISAKAIAVSGKAINIASKSQPIKEVFKNKDGQLLESDDQIAEYLTNNPQIVEFLTEDFGNSDGSIDFQKALDTLNSDPSAFTKFPWMFKKNEIEAIRTYLTKEVNENANNQGADRPIQADPATPSKNNIRDNGPEAQGRADQVSPETPSGRKEQKPNPANPDNAEKPITAGGEGVGSNIANDPLKSKEEEIKARLKAKLEQFGKNRGNLTSGGITPEDIQLVGEIVSDAAELGIVKFKQLMKWIAENMGNDFAKKHFKAFKATYSQVQMMNDNPQGEDFNEIFNAKAEDFIQDQQIKETPKTPAKNEQQDLFKKPAPPQLDLFGNEIKGNEPGQPTKNIKTLEDQTAASGAKVKSIKDRKPAAKQLEKIDGLLTDVENELKLAGYYNARELSDQTEQPVREHAKVFQKDLVKYSKALAKALGWQHDTDKKGKPVYGHANVAPAGGDGTIILWAPDSQYGVYLSFKVNPDYNDTSGFTDPLRLEDNMMWRMTTKDNKYGGLSNQWTTSANTVGEFAKIIQKEAKFYLEKEKGVEPIKTPADLIRAIEKPEVNKVKPEVNKVKPKGKEYKALENVLGDIDNQPIGWYAKSGEIDESAIMRFSVEKQELYEGEKLLNPDMGYDYTGAYKLIMEHNYTQNGDLMTDPRIDLMVIPAEGLIFPISYEMNGMGIYKEYIQDGQIVSPKGIRETREFVFNTWLPNLLEQGRAINPNANLDYYQDGKQGQGSKGQVSPTPRTSNEGVSPDGVRSNEEGGNAGPVSIGETGQNKPSNQDADGAGVRPDNSRGTSKPDSDGKDNPSGGKGTTTNTKNPSGSNKSELEKREAAKKKNKENFKIEEGFEYPNTFKIAERFDQNIKAIQLLVKMIKEDRTTTTAEEKQILFGYSGFGGLAEIAKPLYSSNWSSDSMKNRVEKTINLIKEIDPDGKLGIFDSITGTITSAHYTEPEIIRAHYDFIEKIGFQTGKILDPSSGIGNYFGSMPEFMGKNSNLTGVEIDYITSEIFKRLYPGSNARNQPLQNAVIPENTFDLVISNIPFGKSKINDRSWKGKAGAVYKAAQQKIHNYFVVKMIESAREGGLITILTSNAVLDSPSNRIIRQYMADNTRFIGAVRLPNTAFKGASGTKVVTDIIFLQKRNKGEAIDLSNPILETLERTAGGAKFNINEYFDTNKDHVLGEILGGGQYDKESGYTVDGTSDGLRERIGKIMDKYAKTVEYLPSESKNEIDNQKKVESYKGEEAIRSGNVFEKDGNFFTAISKDSAGNLEGEEINVFKKFHEPFKQFINVRNTLNELLDKERFGYDDSEIDGLRTKLNQQYKKFVKDHGRLHEFSNVLSKDIDSFQVLALEILNKKGEFDRLADIFEKRILSNKPRKITTDSPQEAILISFNEYNRINPVRMEELLGQDWFEKSKEMVYELPDGSFESKDQYLSGNILEKIESLEGLSGMERNLEALNSVLPKKIPITLIRVPLGARYIDPSIYNEFLQDTFGGRPEVSYNDVTDRFTIGGYINSRKELETKRVKGIKIIESAFTDKTIKVNDKIKVNGSEKTVANIVETLEANQAVDRLKTKWQEYLEKNTEIGLQVEDVYNRLFNSSVKRKFDGSHMNFPGLKGVELREHQSDAVNMIVQNNGGVIDHIVGAGKTYIMIAGAMELKRLGVAKKPLIIAKKSTVSQVAETFRKAYPGAKILAPTEKDFSAANRKRFLSQIALNDWDAIILTHDNFDGINPDPESAKQVFEEELALLEMTLEEMRGSKADWGAKQLKGLEDRKANLIAQIDALTNSAKDQEIADFGKLGIDHIMVDESQTFKNLAYSTIHGNVSGLGDKKGSQKSFNLLMAARTLQKIHKGDKGLTFLSGTPISNSMAELYLILKYLRPNRLQELGLRTFDSWAKTFAEKSAETEFSVSGALKEKERFRKFVNVPELAALYTEIADIRNDKNLSLPKPTVKGGKENFTLLKPDENLEQFFKKLIYFADTGDADVLGIDGLEGNFPIEATPKGENGSRMLKVTELATKASMDLRLLYKNAPFNPTSKLAIVANNVAEKYNETTKHKGVQLVFLDGGKTSKYVEGFQTEDEFKRMLVEDFGINPDEIQLMKNFDTDKKKEKLFKEVNQGKVRVLVGSTETMGTGVNVQERIVSMHHVDIPWRPSDYEQRNGRGLRQGNIVAEEFYNNEVEVNVYGVERSLDAYKFELLAIKQAFIDQIKNGATDERVMEEGDSDDENGASFSDFMAAATGNPVIKDKAKNDKEIEKLIASRSAYNNRIGRAKQSLQTSPQEIANLQSMNAELLKWVEMANEDNLQENYPIKVNGKEFEKVTDAGNEINSSMRHTENNIRIMVKGGDKLKPQATVGRWSMYFYNAKNADGSFRKKLIISVKDKTGRELFSESKGMPESPVYVANAIKTYIQNAKKDRIHYQGWIKSLQDGIAENQEIVKETWKDQEAYDKAQLEKQRVAIEVEKMNAEAKEKSSNDVEVFQPMFANRSSNPDKPMFMKGENKAQERAYQKHSVTTNGRVKTYTSIDIPSKKLYAISVEVNSWGEYKEVSDEVLIAAKEYSALTGQIPYDGQENALAEKIEAAKARYENAIKEDGKLSNISGGTTPRGRATGKIPQSDIRFSKASELNRALDEKPTSRTMQQQKGTNRPAKKASEIQAKAEEFTANWANKPEIVVLANPQEALDRYPELREKYSLEDMQQAQALFVQDPKTGKPQAVLIASHSALSEKGGVEKSLLHEIMGHYGVREFLKQQAKGDRKKYLEAYNKLMLEVFDTKKADKFLIDIVDRYFGKKPSELTEEQQMIIGDEYLAHLAQNGISDNLIDRVIAKLRQILRDLGIKIGLSDSDIRNILGNSRRLVEGKNGALAIRKGADGLASPRQMIAGEKGATNLDQQEEVTYRMDNLGVAREMEAGDKNPREIKIATGWERGADGKWRYEVMDGKLKPNPKKYTSLSELLDNPNLFKAYPHLKNISVIFDISPKKSNEGSYTPYVNREQEDLFDIQEEISVKAKDLESGLSILLHEIQHAIQHEEGFTVGGNPSNFRSYEGEINDVAGEALSEFMSLPKEIRAKIKDRWEAEGLPKTSSFSRVKVDGASLDQMFEMAEQIEIIQEYSDNPIFIELENQIIGKISDKDPKDQAYDKYRRLAGEVEARNVEARIPYTEKDRRNTLLSATEDIAREDQLFFENATGISMSVNQDQTQTPAFKAWFGDSKVVDENGEPLVVYHGTDAEFDQFQTPSFFGNKETAESYAIDRSYDSGFNKKVIPVYLNFKNPASEEDVLEVGKELGYKADNELAFSLIDPNINGKYKSDKVISALKIKGFDSAIIDDFRMDSDFDIITSYIAFSPTQIKSATGNNGDFDGRNSDIRFMLGGPSTEAVMSEVNSRNYQDAKLSWFERKVIEPLQDRMIRSKKLIQSKTNGNVSDKADFYTKENLASGKTLEKARIFNKDLWNPLIKTANKIKNATGLKPEDISNYLKFKHHAERKAYFIEQIEADFMAKMDAKYMFSPELQAQYTPSEWADKTDADWTKKYDKLDPKWPTGMTDQEAEDGIGEFESVVDQSLVDQLNDQVRAVSHFTSMERYNSGMITKETFDDLMTRYKNYVPLTDWSGMERTNDKVYTLLMSAKGRSSEAADPMPFLFTAAQEAIMRGEKNRVKQSVLQFVKENIDPGKYFIRNAYYLNTKSQDENGNDIWIETMNKPSADQFESGDAMRSFDPAVHRHVQQQGDQLAVLDVMVKGKKVYIEFKDVDYNDPNAAKFGIVPTIKNINQDQLPRFFEKLRPYTRWLSSMYTQYSPEFGIRNLIRDVGFGTFNILVEQDGSTARSTIAKMPKSALTLVKFLKTDEFPAGKDGKMLQEFMDEGALTGYTELKTAAEVFAETKKAIDKADKQNVWQKGGKAAIKPIQLFGEGLEIYNKTMENSMRFSYYKTLRDQGMSKQQAAAKAKDLTVNFNRKGRSSSVMGTIFIFFNASVQGTERLARSFTNPKTSKKALGYAGGIMAAGMLQSLILSMIDEEDEDGRSYYEKIPDYVRKNHMILPNLFSDTPGDYIKIPLPYGLNIFYAFGESIGRTMTGKTDFTQEAIGMVSAATNVFSPIGGYDFTSDQNGFQQAMMLASPSVIQPLADLGFNRNFAGRPIYRENFTTNQYKLPDSQMYFEGVNPFIKEATTFLNQISGGNEVVAGNIDINPEWLEYGMEQYLGGPVQFGKNLTTTVAEVINGENILQDPFIRKTPFVRSFVQKTGSDFEARADYYRHRDNAITATEAWEKMQEAGLQRDADNFYEKNQGLIQLAEEFKGYEKLVKQLNKTIGELKSADKEMYADDIEKLYEDRTKIMRGFNQQYGEIMYKNRPNPIKDLIKSTK